MPPNRHDCGSGFDRSDPAVPFGRHSLKLFERCDPRSGSATRCAKIFQLSDFFSNFKILVQPLTVELNLAKCLPLLGVVLAQLNLAKAAGSPLAIIFDLVTQRRKVREGWEGDGAIPQSGCNCVPLRLLGGREFWRERNPPLLPPRGDAAPEHKYSLTEIKSCPIID